ncbi:hypothetical protein CAPTEDRAFT_219057 [Capitella teleta]|uniref:Insulin gene enhancer protein ISL-1 n=1 Tax=Capitella teleta TaxID=283909 RepID=R7TFZ7_CAPTE|nr:hypothetical protein CAPTEDRAFT_219057 [Capitella teleta]|eukprot:ELT92649.1 hypothetical protein CAPTEDRAFT_219057 [Capitella teleta]
MAATVECTKKRRRISMCVGCGSQITDQYILRVAPDLEWHASCLRCTDCNQYLDESCTCFVRDGKTYCKRDYVRLFGTKCARCSQSFSKNDFVMRAKNKIYHIDCFRCIACSRQLIPGDEFALRDDGLFCKADHDVVESASTGSITPSPAQDDAKMNILNNNNNNNKDLKLHDVSDDSSSGKLSGGGGGGGGGGGVGGGGGGGGRARGSRNKETKTTRIRTVLNEKQLHTLRTCYSANPRPDALMKEQLTEMTGLSPRVIRVWFQNKRCKDKKKSILMKQMQQQQQEKGVCMSDYGIDGRGIPMVASSPVRHEPPQSMQPTPVEVQHYQAPWKALSEFAMQSELEQPPFQQLVRPFFYSRMRTQPAVISPPPMHSFDPTAHDCGPGGMLPPGALYGQTVGHMEDDHILHTPNSVGSDNTMPGSPSEMSSPLSS